MIEIPKCSCGCDKPVARSGRTGPAPKYATPNCRLRAHRRRQFQDLQSLPDQPAPVTVKVSGQKIDEQIARSILETQSVGFALQRLGLQARPELAWRCTKLGNTIVETLQELFPEQRRK